MSTITGKKGLSFLIFTAFLGSYILTACSGKTGAQPTPNSTATKPAATATYTPSPTATRTPRPTPTPVYQEVQGINVPTNVYLPDNQCIPFELQGVEKCVNMFVYGDRFTVANIWQGIVHVIGDVMAYNLTMEPGTEAYVAVGDVADIFGDLWAEAGYALSGINNTGNWVDGVENGQPYFDDKNHVSIAISGNLTAEGTEDQPILITSAAAEPTRYDWNDFDLSSANLSNVTLEYHRNVGIRSKAIINNSIFRHTGGAALWIDEEATTVYINNTHFYDTQYEGIGGGIPANSVFINNTIEKIGHNICLVIRQDYTESRRPEISGNTLNCYTGIYIGASTISLNNEQLQSLADYYLPQNNFGKRTQYRFAVFKDPDTQTPVFSIK